jgi:hypothetical protein
MVKEDSADGSAARADSVVDVCSRLPRAEIIDERFMKRLQSRKDSEKYKDYSIFTAQTMK